MALGFKKVNIKVRVLNIFFNNLPMRLAIGLCFHVPTSGIPNGGFIAPVLGSCIVLYTLDAAYVFLFMTEKIETTRFYV